MNNMKEKVKRLVDNKGKCEVCSKTGYKFLRNNIYNKTMLLCRNCYSILEGVGYRKTTKYIRDYGMTLKEMAGKYGGCISRYSQLHKRGKLKKFLSTSQEVTD